jgi:uncharacterized protein YwgA
MEMEARHLLLMILDGCGKRIESKTKLHKMAYFISILLKKDFQFNAYFYGPYSRPIENGLDELTDVGFLNMTTCSYGIDSNRGFEKKKYTYDITPSGNELLDHLKKQYPNEYKTIFEYAAVLKDKNYFDLSIAAKAYFILNKEMQPLTQDQIRQKALEFQWNISDNEIDSAIKILDELKLVK